MTPESTNKEILAYLGKLLAAYKEEYHDHVLAVLQRSKINLEGNWCGDDTADYTMTVRVPLDELPFATDPDFKSVLEFCLRNVLDAKHSTEHVRVKPLIEGEMPETTIGLNNCFFKQERTILHDELRFRSKGEIFIYEELKRRNVLFFPNPAAILGTTGVEYGEKVEKKEPDFLICQKGKWGILEISSDDFHTGVVKTTKDHERARRFNHYGVSFIQAYDLDKCKNDSVGVVDEFLTQLANHK